MDILRERIKNLKTKLDSVQKSKRINLKDATLDPETGVLLVDNVEYPCVIFNSREERLLVKKIYMQEKNVAFLDDENADIYGVFSGCENLEEVLFSSSLKTINDSMFENCVNLPRVKLPKSLQSVGVAGFNNCKHLKYVNLPESLTLLEDEGFANCLFLSEIYLPKNLTTLGDFVFDNCKNLKRIFINEENPIYADYDCNIIVNKQTKTVILGCKNSTIPNEVESIGENAFSHCSSLKSIIIPSSVKWVEKNAFSYCKGLNSVHFEEGVKRIENYSFASCEELENINLPKSLEYIGVCAFDNCENLKDVEIDINLYIDKGNWCLFNPINSLTVCTQKRKYDFTKMIADVSNSSCNKGLVFKGYDDNLYYLDNNELAKVSASLLKEKDDIKRKNELNRLEIKDIHKILEWNKYQYVPHYVVVENMPIEEIAFYYKDNNTKNWYTLQKIANQANKKMPSEQKKSLFVLAHALGVFSPIGKESEIATKFIAENILNKYSLPVLHQKLSGWDSENTPFNSEFAKFFIKYFNEYNFLSDVNQSNEKDIVNYMSAIHNRFADIQKSFPHKKVQTRQRNDQLTPELILDVVSGIEYDNVQKNCENLAKTVKRFGYTQKEFEILQMWYLQGLVEDALIQVDADDSVYAIKYELLEKSNPLCAVLGNITNCCQVVNDNGKHCLKYGMTMPNSGFVVFKSRDNILGQAWIWYDAENKQLTLDNIEMPTSVIEKVLKNAKNKEEFLNCVERFCEKTMQKMNQNSVQVNAVTIGLGYNKIGVELIKKYGIIKHASKLTNYISYTDANKQTLICKNAFSNLEVVFPNKEEFKKIQENQTLLVY